MRAALRPLLIGVVLATLAHGCADIGTSSESDRRGGFYGGVSGGGTWP
jgi:hypothetical protein